MNGFVRIAALTPAVTVADPAANAQALAEAFREAAAGGARIAVTPALALTGATCGDLFGLPALRAQTEEALETLRRELRDLPMLCVVGLPVMLENRLFSAAAVLRGGVILGVVPQTQFTRRGAFAENRSFTSGTVLPPGALLGGAPFGTDLLFACGTLRFGILVGDDLFASEPPATRAVRAGAQLLLHLGAEPEGLCRAAFRRDTVRIFSARMTAACVSAWAGPGESTAGGVCSGHRILADNGTVRAESRWERGYSCMDLQPCWIDTLRHREADLSAEPIPAVRPVACGPLPFDADMTYAGLTAHPFVPSDVNELRARCDETLRILTEALVKRFTHTRSRRFVIGLSGGLDSTLALVVCVRACRALGLPPTAVLGVTMPGFGTGTRTRTNVGILAEGYGIELREIPIAPSVLRHFEDIGHDPSVTDVTYENAQARERTQILMDLANQEGGLHVGTGDLSEIALGWSTYGGDHLCMYNVNADIPKTFIPPLLDFAAQDAPRALADALRDICATPVSPELLPGGNQQTESIVGRYEIHDLFLYYFLKYGADRDTLKAIAMRLLGLDEATADRTLEIFCTRFIRQQFKRSCAPDGPRVGSIALGAAHDWCMPADAAMRL